MQFDRILAVILVCALCGCQTLDNVGIGKSKKAPPQTQAPATKAEPAPAESEKPVESSPPRTSPPPKKSGSGASQFDSF